MKGPWDLVAEAPVPDDDRVLYLLRRGNQWSIHVEEYELMSNDEHGSEDALADLAFDRLPMPAPQVLVGGLGMGFTLAAALRRVGDGGVTVAELSEAVVDWNREYTGRRAGFPLRDPRVTVYLGDVCDLIDSSDARWDAILLDVDNGPRALTRPTNGWLYSPEGLARIQRALTPDGVLGVWSSSPYPDFTTRLEEARFREVEPCEHLEPKRYRGERHYLWMARRGRAE